MKCLNCGRVFVNPKWPNSWRSRLRIYKRTGQINGHLFGTWTCSVKCTQVINKIVSAVRKFVIKDQDEKSTTCSMEEDA